jgi:5-methylthioadenosine/S-adenosylhomocysteine deaminase
MLQAIHASWIIPVKPTSDILSNHTLVIEDSVIRDLIPTKDWAPSSQDFKEYNLKEHVLMPGLVNANANASTALLRGSDNSSIQNLIQERRWPDEIGYSSYDLVRDSTLLAGAEMLLSGTTCFGDICIFGDAMAESCITLGLRVAIASLIADDSSVWATNPDDYFSKSEKLHDKYRMHPHIHCRFGTQATVLSSKKTLERLKGLAQELDLTVHLALEPNIYSNKSTATKKSNFTPIEQLATARLLSPKLTVIGSTHLSMGEIDMMNLTGTQAIVCLASDLIKPEGLANVRKLISSSNNVGLGSDSAATNSNFDLFREIASVARIMKSESTKNINFAGSKVLEMSTYGGAKALGLEEIIGSLEASKLADIIAINMNDFRTKPVRNLTEQLINRTEQKQITHVWVGGRLIVEQNKLKNPNSSSLTRVASLYESNP